MRLYCSSENGMFGDFLWTAGIQARGNMNIIDVGCLSEGVPGNQEDGAGKKRNQAGNNSERDRSRPERICNPLANCYLRLREAAALVLARHKIHELTADVSTARE